MRARRALRIPVVEPLPEPLPEPPREPAVVAASRSPETLPTQWVPHRVAQRMFLSAA